jgi:hypothetical protein
MTTYLLDGRVLRLQVMAMISSTCSAQSFASHRTASVSTAQSTPSPTKKQVLQLAALAAVLMLQIAACCWRAHHAGSCNLHAFT